MQLSASVERVVLDLLTQISTRTRPTLRMPRRDNAHAMPAVLGPIGASSAKDTKVISLGLLSAKHFMQIWLCLAFVYNNLLPEGTHCTQREVFYCLLRDFACQDDVNASILDVAGLLRVSREDLGINAAARGLVFGDLTMAYPAKGEETNCREAPQLVPVCNAKTEIAFQSNARFIIVVEKQGIFQNLIDNKLHDMLPCILVTGLGYPSTACRALVHKLANALPSAEVCCLCDYNPHGCSIMLTYKLGSSRMGANLWPVPKLSWIGASHVGCIR